MAGKTGEQAADGLAREIEKIYKMPNKKLDATKKKAYMMMRYVDWSRLVGRYYKAYELAVEKNAKTAPNRKSR
jgi:hypothetical protein